MTTRLVSTPFPIQRHPHTWMIANIRQSPPLPPPPHLVHDPFAYKFNYPQPQLKAKTHNRKKKKKKKKTQNPIYYI